MEQEQEGKLTIDISDILSIEGQPDGEPTQEGATSKATGSEGGESVMQRTSAGGLPANARVGQETSVRLEDDDSANEEGATESSGTHEMSFASLGLGGSGGTGSQGSTQHLPKPPKVADGEKVDTSKLDEALKKRQSSGGAGSTQTVQGTPRSEHLSEESEEQGGWDMSEEGNNEELPTEVAESPSVGQGVSPNGTEAVASESNNTEGSEAQEVASTSEEVTVSADDHGEVQSEGSVDLTVSGESSGSTEGSGLEEEVIAEDHPETSEAPEGNGAKGEGPDPAFAEHLTQTASDDTVAPQTEAPTMQHLESIEADQIAYETPEINELHKHPILEKSATGEPTLSVDRMPIELTFETGRSKITIGELERIKEGYTFECANPVNTPVIIRANDTPIGTGELLDVDGRIGVRVIEFYNK